MTIGLYQPYRKKLATNPMYFLAQPPSQEWMIITMAPEKLMRVNIPMTGQITQSKTAIKGKMTQWKTRKQNLMTKMSEATALVYSQL